MEKPLGTSSYSYLWIVTDLQTHQGHWLDLAGASSEDTGLTQQGHQVT